MMGLPQNWVWTKMLDMLDYEGGSQPPKKVFVYQPRIGYVRLLQIRDFGDKPFPTYVPDSHRLKKANRDDLLLARYGGSSASDSLGRICTGLEGAYNVALAKLVFCRDLLDANYVKYLFLGPWFKEKVGQNSRSCQTGFNRDDVVDIEFPLAPLNEQRRIAAKLEEVLSRVDAAQARLNTVPPLLRRFRQSVLAAACSGRLTTDWRMGNKAKSLEPTLLKSLRRDRKLLEASQNGSRFKSSNSFDWDMFPALPDTWCWAAAAEIVEATAEIVYGIVQPGPEVVNGVPYVRGLDIQNGRILIEQLRKTSHEIAKRYERAALKEGDVLLGIIRNTKVAVVPKALSGANITQGTARLRPSTLVGTGFLAMWLESKYAQDWLHMHYRGIDMPGLNLADVRKLPVPLPPLDEQEEIVRRVEALLKTADALEARYLKAKAHVDKLTQSILAKAFRGELVPQDPNDEPALVLLERIREQRNGTPVKKARSGRKKSQK